MSNPIVQPWLPSSQPDSPAPREPTGGSPVPETGSRPSGHPTPCGAGAAAGAIVVDGRGASVPDRRASIRVLVCDDHKVARRGLRRLLERVEDIEVVADAGDGLAAVQAAARERPDVVLMDLVMPVLDGVEATRRILARLPETKVLVLTCFAEEPRMLAAVDAGADGYLLKDAPVEQVIHAIRAAACGEAFLDPRAARAIIARQATRDPLADITDRGREVLSLLAAGQPTKLIALRMGIAQATVKCHLNRIYRAIDVENRAQAALWARLRGL